MAASSETKKQTFGKELKILWFLWLEFFGFRQDSARFLKFVRNRSSVAIASVPFNDTEPIRTKRTELV